MHTQFKGASPALTAEQVIVDMGVEPVTFSGPARFGIVIPVFKHSVLLSEAAQSAVDEARRSGGIIVIVNDGCPFEETHLACLEIAAANSDCVRYLRTPNGGLSAARNRGINEVLRIAPSIEAIYLLDADNRLSKGSMARTFDLLESTGADWVYPSIDKFGLEWSGDYSAPYSVLNHLFQNICEAGSLVHRRVFDAGIRYDETMRQGYEDWDFWLQCASAGFRGVSCSSFGFEYRARRESMVRDSDRVGGELLGYIRRKHKRLFSWHSMIDLEHAEVPRLAIFEADRRKVRLTSQVRLATRTVDDDEIDADFWRHYAAPHAAHFPNFLIFTSAATIDRLEEIKLLDWAFWSLEDLSSKFSFVMLTLRRGGPSIEVELLEGERASAINENDVVAIATTLDCFKACIKDPGTVWVRSILSSRPLPSICTISITAPLAQPLERKSAFKPHYELLRVCDLFRESPFREVAEQKWDWRSPDALLNRAFLFRNVREELRALAPVTTDLLDKGPEVAFVMPVSEFGGVEQVALNLARLFKQRGWRIRFVITMGMRVGNAKAVAEIADTIMFLNDPGSAQWCDSGFVYFGHDLQKWAAEGPVDRLVGQLIGCDAIINFQSMHLNEITGWLRKHGVVTVSSLHLIDRDQFGGTQGHPYWMLAYEHAYDLITAPSEQLLGFCHGTGVPSSKLHLLRNAPTFDVKPEHIEQRFKALQERAAQKELGSPLRVLYIGRLDRQKGLDRLTGVVARTRELGLPIEWRFTGGSVIPDDSAVDAFRESNVWLEPAVYDREAVIERLLWADVILLLSNWEGSPLIILEAQALGAVPIATDVGAISEMIDHGNNGFIVDNTEIGQIVDATVETLNRLSEDTGLLDKVARHAIEGGRETTWANTAKEFLDKIDKMVRAKKRKPTKSCSVKSSKS